MPLPHDNLDDESLFAQLFEVSPDGELVVADDGRVRLANPEAHRVLGWPPGTLIEHRLSELLPERFRSIHPVTAHPGLLSPRRMGEVKDEFVAHRRDGTEIPIEITMSAVRAGSDQLHHLTIRDVSAPHEAERKLHESVTVRDAPPDGIHRSSIGLGLFIANEIVRAHGGSIAVRSPDRNGTTFSIVLPRRSAGIWSSGEPAPPQLH
jgi:PAS domain S-box-containing protein